MRRLIFFIFIAFFIGNTVAPFWMIDKETLSFQLVDLKDVETEKEEEKQEEELDKKIRLFFSDTHLFSKLITTAPENWPSFRSLHPPEIITPPPEQV